jgi:oligopeptide/dipeptide ABC transporter ATP-binding protein
MIDVIMLHEGLEKEQAIEHAKKLLKAVGLPADRVLNSYPHELSGGMRQRVMIAMALSGSPKLLIADEPTTALDVSIQAQILTLIKRLQKEFGTSVLLISHDLGVIATMAQKVAVMYAGRIVEYGRVEQIFENPLHPYTRGLLKAIPDLDEEREWLEVIPGSVPNLIYPPEGCRFHPRCAYVREICKREKPPLIEVEEGHKVACYEYNKG